MRAAVMRNRQIVVDTLPDPEPGPCEVLVKTLACGICGSDLHALTHADKLVEAARESGAPFGMDPSRDIVMGHEFCAEVIDYGPDTTGNAKPGERVVSMPLLFRGMTPHGIGYSNEVPGGYGELMVLAASLALPVPNGLSTDRAALTEPMAVGWHAVEMARLEPHDAALVVGCGPVGLAVIAALALRGVEPIVAADYSPRAPRPGAGDGRTRRRRSQGAAGGGHVSRGGRSPPGRVLRVRRRARHAARAHADAHSGATRIVVAGVCMDDDTIRPMIGINKELSVQFVLGYTPGEFMETLAAIADGRIDVAPLVTGTVGVEGVAQAFRDLANPDRHAKILVEPWRA